MLETSYGTFDGDSWEKICQICFKQKYKDEQYIEMIASPGDFGIEGFTKTGKVFQCYCPDHSYTRDELYTHQRNKITKDLKKLQHFEGELKRRLGETKIKEWIFLTPEFSKNEIISHCTTKAEEIRSLNLSILDPDFVVLPQDVEHLIPFISNALSATNRKLLLKVEESASLYKVTNYKMSDNALVDNALTKHSARLSQSNSTINPEKVDKLTNRTIKHFLDGKEILNRWKNMIQEDYERFIKVVSLYEEEVEEICLFSTDDFNGRLEEIKFTLKEKIAKSFPTLDSITVQELTNHVVADWILRCPINFENS